MNHGSIVGGNHIGHFTPSLNHPVNPQNWQHNGNWRHGGEFAEHGHGRDFDHDRFFGGFSPFFGGFGFGGLGFYDPFLWDSWPYYGAYGYADYGYPGYGYYDYGYAPYYESGPVAYAGAVPANTTAYAPVTQEPPAMAEERDHVE